YLSMLFLMHPAVLPLDLHSFPTRRSSDLFVSSFSGGEVFRSGCTFRRGKGKIFYFSPGDQDYPVYHHPDVRRVIANGVRWARPVVADRQMPFLDRYETEWFTKGTGGQGLGDNEAAGKNA